MNGKCPACGGRNIEVGAFPLRCIDCDWNHLNKYPCDVCGEPSYSSYGANGRSGNYCRLHTPTDPVAEMVRLEGNV